MSLVTHTVAGILFALAVLLLSPIIASGESYRQALNSEIEESVRLMGYEHSRNAVDDLKKRYELIARITHLERVVDAIDKGISKLPHRNGKLFGVFELQEGAFARATGGPVYSVYMMCWRLGNYLLWGGYVLPLLLALAFDGLMKRKILAVNEHYWSPSHYNIVWHIIITVLTLAIASVGVAVALPSATYPALLVGVGLLLRSLITHLQVSA